MTTLSPLDAIADDLDVLGLHWIDGVGFRPIDGWEHVAPREMCEPVGASWKNTETDEVERDYDCPPVAKWASTGPLFAPWPDAAEWSPVALPISAPGQFSPFTPYAPVWICGGSTWTECGCETPPETPVAPVPLPAALPLLLVAVVALAAVRRTTR